MRRRRRVRRGATTVEFAFVAMPLVLVVFGSVEFGRAVMAMQCLEEASRAGCRTAVLEGATVDDVESTISPVLRSAGIGQYAVVVEPSSLETAEQWSPVTVNISASYHDLTWIPAPSYLSDMTYTATCTLPREANRKD